MRLSQRELRSVIREEAQRLLSERTEGVVEHDERFEQMMQLLASLMNEYEMDPKAIANLAARRIYERMPKPPWVNDADAHTLKGEEGEKPDGEGEAMAAGKGNEPKKAAPKAEQEHRDDDEMLFDEGGYKPHRAPRASGGYKPHRAKSIGKTFKAHVAPKAWR